MNRGNEMKMKKWSSQWTQFMQLRKEAWIFFRLLYAINTWGPTWFFVQTTGFNRSAKFLILLKHWGYDNFELNWFHVLSKSPAIPFSQVSADSFRVSIQECSRYLYAFIAFRPTCFARRETSTKHPPSARGNFIPILKITRDELPME